MKETTKSVLANITYSAQRIECESSWIHQYEDTLVDGIITKEKYIARLNEYIKRVETELDNIIFKVSEIQEG